MKGYLVARNTPGEIVKPGEDRQPYVTREEHLFFEEDIKIDPFGVIHQGRTMEPGYEQYRGDALAWRYGFEMPGKKDPTKKYLLIIEGKYVRVG